ncbi:MAG TPA: hypothetical protein VKP30_16695 [Polyangiaceae bacterium]|nr:hypothetical protein [Polyangiaceae bacterium]
MASRTQPSRARKTILLARSKGDDEVIAAIRAELHIRGWRIVEARGTGTEAAESSLAQLVSEQTAAAAVRVNRDSGRIELYVTRPSGNVEETIRLEGKALDGPVLALRVTEILRAHGLDFGDRVAPESTAAFSQDADDAPRQVSPQPTNVHRSDTRASVATGQSQVLEAAGSELLPRNRSLWLELGPALIESAGGWRTNLGVLAGVRLAFDPDWSLTLTGIAPITSDAVVAAAGRASVRTSGLGLSVARTLFRRSFGSSAVGLGAALLGTSMRGSAQPGYVDKDDFVLTQAPFGYLRVAATVHQDWHCFASLLGGISIPEVAVAFDGIVQRTWGRPFALLNVGIETRALSW